MAAASASRTVSAARAAVTATPAQTSSPVWNAGMLAWPAAVPTGWRADRTAVSRATPTAPPTWRWALKMVDATPVRCAPTVAKPAAWLGMNTAATPNPMTKR